MREAILIFPNQLLSDHPALDHARDVILVEDSLFFGDDAHPLTYHVSKLVFHRASMQAYAKLLRDRDYTVIYREYIPHTTITDTLDMVQKDYNALHIMDPVDYELTKRIKAHSIPVTYYESGLFFNTSDRNKTFFADTKPPKMASFYKEQRRHLNVLMKDDEPVGGTWSFDEENRKKIPKSLRDEVPDLPSPMHSHWVDEAKEYVAKNFSTRGTAEHFFYPVTHDTAKHWLASFCEERFKTFGPYEDAIESDKHILYHSVLSPLLNSGLLTPQEVLEEITTYTEKHDITLPSYEGFVRQLIGWREYMRATYVHYGSHMRIQNVWNHTRPLSEKLYTGTTGLTPYDDAVTKTLETGYAHHIERLMIIGNLLFVCEIHPDDIYTWFMEHYIDAYDWVMVPNVYGMSQNSAGDLITTKPYFSGSNYILKMSSYKKEDWAEAWDGLYWNFIAKHQETLKDNPRWSMMVGLYQHMHTDTKEAHTKNANAFLMSLDH